MSSAEFGFWEFKLYALLHDPPHKVFKIRGHAKSALTLLKTALPHQAQVQAQKGRIHLLSDPESASADRLTIPANQGKVDWSKNSESIVTHPLGGARLKYRVERPGEVFSEAEAFLEAWLREHAVGPNFSAQQLVMRFWRDLPDAFERANLQLGHGWHLIPGDSRLPDHSIWDHCRLASAFEGTAAAFHSNQTLAVNQRRPYLLVVKLSGVQRLIAESRKIRDVWFGSYLMADLAWAALLPIVTALGADAVLYPDLRANPFADQWLHSQGLAPLSQTRVPKTYTSMLPNKFVALVHPGAIQDGEDLPKKVQAALLARWNELHTKVRGWIEGRLTEAEQELEHSFEQWKEIWDRQLASACPRLRWVAMPISANDNRETGAPQKDKQSKAIDQVLRLAVIESRAKSPEKAGRMENEAKTESDRHWNIWQTMLETPKHMSDAKRTGKKTETEVGMDSKSDENGEEPVPSYLNQKRMFLYPALHHEASMRLLGLGWMDFEAGDGAELGVKCSVDGRREALRFDVGPEASFKQQKEAADAFWSLPEFREGPLEEAERLSAVSAFKRFLIRAEAESAEEGGSGDGVHSRSLPLSARFHESGGDGKGKAWTRAPFPPLFLVANADWLAEKLQNPAILEQLGQPLAALVAFMEAEGIERTQYLESYPVLLELLAKARESHPETGALLAEFLGGPGTCGWDLRYLQFQTFKSYFRKYQDWLRQSESEGKSGKSESDFKARLPELLAEAEAKLGAVLSVLEGRASKLATHFAVMRMDGDAMGQLLLGLHDRIPCSYREVLHPNAIAFLEGKNESGGRDFKSLYPNFPWAGWEKILDEKRLMTPSLHAFISRALAHFAYEVAPYFVEKVHFGRLIYAGGDDLLAFVPASRALALAIDLRRAFCSGWLKGDWRCESREKPGAGIEFPDPGSIEPRPEERWFPQLGPAGRISGSIVYAHFKTSLQPLLRHSEALLETVAKGALGREALALSCFTRGGEKYLMACHWPGWSGEPAAADGSAGANALDCLGKLCAAFAGEGREGKASFCLPNRLPYKLRELLPLLGLEAGGSLGEIQRQLLRNKLRDLLRRQRGLEGEPDSARDSAGEEAVRGESEAVECLLKALELGREFCLEMEKQGEPADPLVVPLLARFLAKGLSEEER